MRKPIVVLDFDGVIHSYKSGWKGADVIPDEPVDGAMAAVVQYADNFDLHIYSARSGQTGGIDAMKGWLADNLIKHFSSFTPEGLADEFTQEVIEKITWPTEKPPALVTIDDRAIQFTGEWPTVQTIANFKPWNAKEV